MSLTFQSMLQQNRMLQIGRDQVSFELHIDTLKLTKEVCLIQSAAMEMMENSLCQFSFGFHRDEHCFHVGMANSASYLFRGIFLRL